MRHLHVVPYVVPGRPTEAGTGLQQLAREWVTWKRRTGQINQITAKEQRYVISYFVLAMGNRRAQQIGESDLERWRAEMTDRLSPGTIRHRWRTAYGFLEWLVDEGKIRRNPARRIPTPKVPRAVHRNLRPDQATALHDACIDSRERLIVALGFQLGMRRSEIARAELGDFDFVARSVRIVGKGGHQRALHVTDQAYAEVISHLGIQGAVAGPLLRSQQFPQRGLHPDTVSTIVRRAMQDSGVKRAPRDGVSAHALRHSALTDMLRNGAHIRDVQAAAGHAHITATETYIPLLVGTLQEAMGGRWYGPAPLRSVS